MQKGDLSIFFFLLFLLIATKDCCTNQTKMNKNIEQKLENASKNLQTLIDFANKYDLPEDADLYGFDSKPRVNLTDVVATGKIFGKLGWVRERERYSERVTYSWTQTIDDVIVKIAGAEVHGDMNGVPVSPKAFPIQIEEAAS